MPIKHFDVVIELLGADQLEQRGDVRRVPVLVGERGYYFLVCTSRRLSKQEVLSVPMWYPHLKRMGSSGASSSSSSAAQSGPVAHLAMYSTR